MEEEEYTHKSVRVEREGLFVGSILYALAYRFSISQIMSTSWRKSDFSGIEIVLGVLVSD